ncbi:MAG: hypothetical protein H0W99_01630, partial [Acidobacteria bacterium]|nr:hypothetical protein [Acidobacteriota bacterium]
MSYRNLFAALLIAFAFAQVALAQSPTATPNAAAQNPAPSKPLAVINNQQITLADIDPQIRASIENLDKDVADVRRRVLDLQIAQMLLEAEAKKSNTTYEQLVKAEISSKVSDPTEVEIKALYDANRNYFGATDLEQARPTIRQ